MHMSDDPEFTIRALTTDDLDQYNALLRYAFQVTEQELMMTGWKDDDFVRSKFPILERADVLGCYDGDQLVSQFAVYPLQMNIHSEICSVGYVTSVTTYPEYSGRGLMRRLMYRSLVRMREKGQVLALLFPFSMPLYRKFGWEIISNKISYVVKDNQFVPQRKHEAPGYVRRVNWDNPGFIDLHLRFAMRTHGCILRSTAAWDEYWRWEVEDTNVAVYYSTDDRPLGYMVYIIKDDVMHIKEMIYLNREAKKGLWEYISAHYSMIDEVRGFTYHNELLAFDLEDGKITETIRPYVMGRIVDVAEFFDGSVPRRQGQGRHRRGAEVHRQDEHQLPVHTAAGVHACIAAQLVGEAGRQPGGGADPGRGNPPRDPVHIGLHLTWVNSDRLALCASGCATC